MTVGLRGERIVAKSGVGVSGVRVQAAGRATRGRQVEEREKGDEAGIWTVDV